MRLSTRRLGMAAGIIVAMLSGTLAAAGRASADSVGPPIPRSTWCPPTGIPTGFTTTS